MSSNYPSAGSLLLWLAFPFIKCSFRIAGLRVGAMDGENHTLTHGHTHTEVPTEMQALASSVSEVSGMY